MGYSLVLTIITIFGEDNNDREKIKYNSMWEPPTWFFYVILGVLNAGKN